MKSNEHKMQNTCVYIYTAFLYFNQTDLHIYTYTYTFFDSVHWQGLETKIEPVAWASPARDMAWKHSFSLKEPGTYWRNGRSQVRHSKYISLEHLI